MTTHPIPLPNKVKTKAPERQLTLEQEGRLRIVTSILEKDRSRPTDEVEALVELVLFGPVDDEEDET